MVGMVMSSMNWSLRKSLRKLNWREEAKKASELGIKFDTMTIDPMYVEWYKELSAMTNGVSVPFKNSGKTSQMI